MQFSVTVKGIETIDRDFEAFEKDLAAGITAAMDTVGQAMKDELGLFIEQDVYNAYDPVDYKRRSENPQYGTPLNDLDRNATVANLGNGVSLDYHPTGEHSGMPGVIQKHGDALIRTIETGAGYTFESKKIKPRPFWSNFVESEFGAQMSFDTSAFRQFQSAMKAVGFDVISDGNDVFSDGSDGNY